MEVTPNENSGVGHLANPGLRIIAFMLDAFILSTVYGAALMLLAGSNNEDIFYGGLIYIILTYIPFQILYHTLFECSARQGTPGKQIMKIYVTDMDGNRLTFIRSLGRYLCKIVSAGVAMIGFVMIFFTRYNQGLHDMLAATLVLERVNKN